jgi:hypothetical protein
MLVGSMNQAINDGQKVIARLIRDGFDVAVAGWVKESDYGHWFLYLASRKVDEQGAAAAYAAVQKSLQRLPTSQVSLNEIKVIGATSPMAADMLSVQQHGGGGTFSPAPRARLGDESVDEAYIYPFPYVTPVGGLLLSRDEVLQRVLDLISQSGTVSPVTVGLRDGFSFPGVPFSLERTNNQVNVVFVDTSSNSPRTVAVDDVATIN